MKNQRPSGSTQGILCSVLRVTVQRKKSANAGHTQTASVIKHVSPQHRQKPRSCVRKKNKTRKPSQGKNQCPPPAWGLPCGRPGSVSSSAPPQRWRLQREFLRGKSAVSSLPSSGFAPFTTPTPRGTSNASCIGGNIYYPPPRTVVKS